MREGEKEGRRGVSQKSSAAIHEVGSRLAAKACRSGDEMVMGIAIGLGCRSASLR